MEEFVIERPHLGDSEDSSSTAASTQKINSENFPEVSTFPVYLVCTLGLTYIPYSLR